MPKQFINGIPYRKIGGERTPEAAGVSKAAPQKEPKKKEAIRPQEAPSPLPVDLAPKAPDVVELVQERLPERPKESLAPVLPETPPPPEPVKPILLKIEITLSGHVKTGRPIPIPNMPSQVTGVTWNNFRLDPRTDYAIQGKNLAIAFNIGKGSKIVLEGF